MTIKGVELLQKEGGKLILPNHQSHIDLIYNMSMSSKIIILTNDWVQKSKIYGQGNN